MSAIDDRATATSAGEVALRADPAGQATPVAPAEVLQRRWLVFGIVSIGLFMASIDQTIVATALPAIEHDLHAGINWSGWTITIYALGQVIAMPMAGKISDMYGRKKVFAVSAAVFTLASLCCGFAPNMALLLVPRFIQALGGGAFLSEENFQMVSNNGVSVWLDCPFAMVERRLAGYGHRPLARDPEKLRELFAVRRAGYERAGTHEAPPAAGSEAAKSRSGRSKFASLRSQ